MRLPIIFKSIIISISSAYLLSSCSVEHHKDEYMIASNKNYRDIIKLDSIEGKKLLYNDILDKLNQTIKITKPKALIQPWSLVFGNNKNNVGNTSVGGTIFKKKMQITKMAVNNGQILIKGNKLLSLLGGEIALHKIFGNNTFLQWKHFMPFKGCKKPYAPFILEKSINIICSIGSFKNAALYSFSAINGKYKSYNTQKVIPSLSSAILINKNKAAIRGASSVIVFKESGNKITFKSVKMPLRAFYSGHGMFGAPMLAKYKNDIYFTIDENAEHIGIFNILKHKITTIKPDNVSAKYFMQSNATITIDKNIAYYLNYIGIRGVNLDNKKTVINVDGIASDAPLIIDGNYIFVHNTSSNRVNAINKNTGKIAWRSHAIIKSKVAQIIMLNDRIIVPDNENMQIFSISAKNGRTLYKQKISSPVSTNMMVHKRKACYVDGDGYLNCTA